MAMQTTMGTHSDMHVSKRALYWALGVIVALFLAIGFSMSRNNNVSDTTRGSTIQDTRGTARDSAAGTGGVNGSADSGGYQRSSPANDGNAAGTQ